MQCQIFVCIFSCSKPVNSNLCPPANAVIYFFQKQEYRMNFCGDIAGVAMELEESLYPLLRVVSIGWRAEKERIATGQPWDRIGVISLPFMWSTRRHRLTSSCFLSHSKHDKATLSLFGVKFLGLKTLGSLAMEF